MKIQDKMRAGQMAPEHCHGIHLDLHQMLEGRTFELWWGPNPFMYLGSTWASCIFQSRTG